MELERKTFSVKLADANDEGEAVFVASVFDVLDQGGDVVLAGAFSETLRHRTPKFVADHRWETTAKLGRVLGADETDEGLEVRVRFNLEKQIARDVYSDFRFDPDGQEFSIGYVIPEGGSETKAGVRYISRIDLYEVSPVLVGMNASTRLVSVKSDEAEAEPEPEPEPEPAPDYSALVERLDEMRSRIEELLAE